MNNFDEPYLMIQPHSIEAESAVLGGMLIRNDAWDDIVGVVSEADFYRPDNRVIFRAFEKLADTNQPFDPVTLCEAIGDKGLVKQIGGIGYLVELAENTPTSRNIKAYATAVRNKSMERKLITSAQEIVELALSPEESVEDKINTAQSMMMAIEPDRTQGPVQADTRIGSVIDAIDERFNSDQKFHGLSTGLTALDEKIRGLKPSDLILLAGRPSMGKTTAAMNIAEHVAVTLREPVLVFSMEMSTEQLLERSCSSLSKVPFKRIQDGDLLSEDWPKLSAGVSKLKGAPLFINDAAALSVSQIRSQARKIKRQHGLSLIIVDYLQLGRGSGDSREQEISSISRGYKAIAKELGVPFIALSQLNRNLEQRPDKRPKNADLRDSGSLEQDADLIMFTYRDEVYNEDSAHKGIAEIIITKFRNGELGKAFLKTNFNVCRFDNLSHTPPPMCESPLREPGFVYD